MERSISIRSCKPKWLELEADERYVKSVLARQGFFIFMMAGIVLLSAIFVIAMIFGDIGEVIMPLGVMLGSFSTVGPLLGSHKLHLTSQRLVMEIKHKNAGEIRLDQIEAIQVTKTVGGGKVLVVPAVRGLGAFQIQAVKPYQLANEISELGASLDNNSEYNGSEFSKGDVQ